MATMAADAPTLATGTDPTASAARVERERVTDSVTGLPVLRYRFAGPPTLRPGMAAPSGAWRVLRVDERDGHTTLDLETAAGAEPLDLRPARIDDGVVEAALVTLGRARTCGAVHGDLGPQRLWRRGEHVWIEGYGVRWRDDADAETDARDLASGLLRLTGTRLSPATRARLGAIVERGDVSATAEFPSDAAPPTPATEAARSEVDHDGGDRRLVRGPPPGARVRRGGAGMRAAVTVGAQEWATWIARTTASLSREAASAARRLAARVPPLPRASDTATWADGGLDPSLRRGLAVALLVGSLVWFGLASWSDRVGATPAVSPPPTAGHVVDVSVDPEGQPPVTLVVLASPPGSRFAPGAVIASVPSKVWLDLDGRWRFEARFGEGRSPAVDLILPFERALRLAFPQPAAP
jgi:hypothetical protein